MQEVHESTHLYTNGFQSFLNASMSFLTILSVEDGLLQVDYDGDLYRLVDVLLHSTS